MSDSAAYRSTDSELRLSNRALRVQSEVNRVLIRSTDETALLCELCRIAVETGGYGMAWIGLVPSAAPGAGPMEVAAAFEAGKADQTKIIIPEDVKGRGPAGLALRIRKTCVDQDSDVDDSSVSWRHAARAHGYLSVIALPLIEEGKAFGVLTIYSREEETFTGEIGTILSEVASDVAFGLGALRKRFQHRHADELLHQREQEFRAFVENSPDLILRFNREYQETYVNPAVCQTFGFSADAFLNKKIGATSHNAGLKTNAEGHSQVRQCIQSVFEKGAPTELEVHWPTAHGERVYSVRYFPEFDRAGNVSSVLAISRDISKRRRLEEALKTVLRHARSIVMRAIVTAPEGWEQQSPEWAAANFYWDSKFDDEASAQEGLPLAVPSGHDYYYGWNRAKHSDDLVPMGLTAHRVFLAGGKSWNQQFRCTDQHGRLHWFDQVASVESTGHGRWQVTTVNTDITERKLAEDAILAREREFRALAENTPDFIVRWDRELRRIYVNPAFAAAMSVTPQQLIGGDLGTHYPDSLIRNRADSIEAFSTMIKRVIADEKPAEILISWTTVAGETFYYVRFIPEFDNNGKLTTVLGIGRDVTALKETEEQLRALTDNSPDLIVRFDREYRYLYINRAIEPLTGLSASLHIGKRVGEVATPDGSAVLPDGIQLIRRGIDRVFATGNPTEIEGTIRFRRGEIILDGRFVPEFNQIGEVASVLVIARDVTERKRAEEALRSSQQAFASLVTTIDGIVWEADAQTFQFSFVSPQAARILGYPTEQWLNDPNFWASHLHPEDRDRAVSYCVAAVEQKRDHTFQYRMIAADGRAIWLHDFVTVVVEKDRPVKLRGILVDISKSKRTEEALALFRTLLDHATDAIEVIDPATGRFLDVNDTACRTHGFTREEFLSLTVGDIECKLDFTEPGLWQKNVEQIKRFGSRIMEGEHRRKDGSRFPVEINANYVSETRDYVVAIVRDITKRKHTEEALRESEYRFRQVTETIDEVFWLTDVSKSQMIYVSPAYEKIWGRSRESLHASPKSWLDAIHPEDRERVNTALELQSTGGYDIEYRIVRPDGAVRSIHDRAFPIKDANSQVYRIAGVAEDVTTRLQLEEQFRQSQKMEAVGQLAGGIAHDFNNLLTVVQMQTSLMLDSQPSDPGVDQGLRQIMEAATRAANLTRQLLAFSRQNVKQAQALDLSGVVTGTTKLLRRVLGEHISLESRFASNLPFIHADPGMMEQVLMNLVINARDAMPNGGRLVISLDLANVDERYVAAHPSARTGRFVQLTVRDTGSGIAPEVLPRIFEPFFTTKEVGKGTGLGLATVFGIVQHHHGWIEIESQVGRGSTFRVFLPPLEGAVQPASASPSATASGGSETVLLVEDEPAVSAVATRALERRGYRVLKAGSAADALRVWEESDGKVDLLLTDLIMPGGVTGQQLATRLRTKRPGLKVIYMSGYSRETINGGHQFEPGRNFLPKPYPLEELTAIVRRRLDEA